MAQPKPINPFGIVSALELWRYNRTLLAADAHPEETVRAAIRSKGLDNGFYAALTNSMFHTTPSFAPGAETGASENRHGGEVHLDALLLTYMLDGSFARKVYR